MTNLLLLRKCSFLLMSGILKPSFFDSVELLWTVHLSVHLLQPLHLHSLTLSQNLFIHHLLHSFTLFTSSFTSSLQSCTLFHPSSSPSLDTPSSALPLLPYVAEKVIMKHTGIFMVLEQITFCVWLQWWFVWPVCVCVCVCVLIWKNCYISVLWARCIRGGQKLMGAIWTEEEGRYERSISVLVKSHTRALKQRHTLMYFCCVLTFISDE